jgi:hypothetical protein
VLILKKIKIYYFNIFLNKKNLKSHQINLHAFHAVRPHLTTQIQPQEIGVQFFMGPASCSLQEPGP